MCRACTVLYSSGMRATGEDSPANYSSVALGATTKTSRPRFS